MSNTTTSETKNGPKRKVVPYDVYEDVRPRNKGNDDWDDDSEQEPYDK